jgi:hypothetical protein
MHVTPHKLTVEEVADLKHSCVLIDDSGTPGQVGGSTYLDPSRKTWVAVITSPQQMREIADEIFGALGELQSQTEASEFHFTEIYRGAGAFKDAPLPLRQALFAFMRHIFELYMFPVLVQTFSESDLADIYSRASFPPKLGVFDLHQPSDASLLFLLLRVRRFLSEHSSEYPVPAYVVLDEGFRPADRAIEIPTFRQHFHRSSIFTCRSSEFCALQLADFAAFCVSRTQWLLTKDKRSKVDAEFMEIVAGLRLNILDLPEATIDLQSWTPQDYEQITDEDRIGKGLKPRERNA